MWSVINFIIYSIISTKQFISAVYDIPEREIILIIAKQIIIFSI